MDYLLYALVVTFMVLLVVSLCRAFIYGYTLNSLVCDKYPDKWKYITTIPGCGPGGVNAIRADRFLFSDEDFGDKEVFRLRIIVKRSWIYVLTAVPAIGIVFYIATRLAAA